MSYWQDDKGQVHPLARCPFCGKEVAYLLSQAEMWDTDEDLVDRYTVVCDADKKGCGATCGFRKTKEEAANSWNRRTVI